MLWYKAWLETRARFLICLFGTLLLCSYGVLHGEQIAEPWFHRSYHDHVLTEGYALLKMMWVLAVTLLMMGGLVREQAHGTASFTLGLPVSRRRLMMVRIGAGALQAGVIALLPCCAMYLIATIWSAPLSASQNLFHLVLMVAGGAFFFGVALLASSVVPGEYTAPAVAFGVVLLTTAPLGDPKRRMFSPLAFMFGTDYFDVHTQLLVGPIPWMEAAIWLFLAAMLTWIAVLVIDRRDF